MKECLQIGRKYGLRVQTVRASGTRAWWGISEVWLMWIEDHLVVASRSALEGCQTGLITYVRRKRSKIRRGHCDFSPITWVAIAIFCLTWNLKLETADANIEVFISQRSLIKVLISSIWINFSILVLQSRVDPRPLLSQPKMITPRRLCEYDPWELPRWWWWQWLSHVSLIYSGNCRRYCAVFTSHHSDSPSTLLSASASTTSRIRYAVLLLFRRYMRLAC